MWKAILHLVKATFPIIAGCFTFIPVFSQQNIIADKDQTRPEIASQYTSPAKITFFSAEKLNGYNDIQWSALSEENTRRFIVEYSTDGTNYQTAGEALPVEGVYCLKHYTFETRPLLYRIRIEKTDGKYFNSAAVLLNGEAVLPVNIYSNIIKGNVVNVNADFPVERTVVTSSQGQQVFAKDLAGASGYIPVAIPTLNKGMYWMTFYGNGWKTTSKFIIAE